MTCRPPWSTRSAFSTPIGSTRRSSFRWWSCRPAPRTDPAVTARLKSLLEGIGKVPVVCAARPGYIVPRIQALAMNEAARMVEEGVASAEDIDKAIKYGFGIRYANLGMLEFIDYGGGDILYYASRYLTQALGDRALRRARHHRAQHGRGPHRPQDRPGLPRLRQARHRSLSRDRLKALVDMLGFMGLSRPPVLPE